MSDKRNPRKIRRSFCDGVGFLGRERLDDFAITVDYTLPCFRGSRAGRCGRPAGYRKKSRTILTRPSVAFSGISSPSQLMEKWAFLWVGFT